MVKFQLKDVVTSEALLCEFFIEEFNEVPGWTCYPETGGFDVLVVHESGRQIGVEAKLQLNAKVAEQILPHDCWYRRGEAGPDHRLVIVRNITDANKGIARMLDRLGVSVWTPYVTAKTNPLSGVSEETGRRELVPWVNFNAKSKLMFEGFSAGDFNERPRTTPAMFDWNPVERISVPSVVPNLPAGVPSPIQMTPWKEAAVRVVARLRQQGHITTKQIAAEGCSPSTWTQNWLDKGGTRGLWVETDRMPKFDEQHPEMYALALAAAKELAQESSA